MFSSPSLQEHFQSIFSWTSFPITSEANHHFIQLSLKCIRLQPACHGLNIKHSPKKPVCLRHGPQIALQFNDDRILWVLMSSVG